MQVSWIDQNEVAGLLAGLSGSSTPAHARLETAAGIAPDKQDDAGWDGWITDFATPQASMLETTSSAGVDQNAGQHLDEPSSSEKEIDNIRERLRLIREQAVSAGLMHGGGATPAPQPSTNTPPRAQPGQAAGESGTLSASDLDFDHSCSLGERLEAFAEWAGGRLGGAEILVLDEHGDLLWGPPNAAGLVLSTLMALNSARRDSAEAFTGNSSRMTREIAPGRQLTLVACPTRLGFLQAAIVRQEPLTEKAAEDLRAGLARVVEAGAD